MRTTRVALLTLAVAFWVHEALAASGGVTARTNKSGGTGCSSCHGATADTAITATISGPTGLIPGQVGTYTISAAKSVANGIKVGIDVAASDTASLSVVAGEPTSLVSGEITHNINVGALRTISNGSASYQFKYTMPASAALNSTHTLYGVVVVGLNYGNGYWRHAANFTVTTVAAATPTTLTATTPITDPQTSMDLSWSGTSPQFRVIYKVGANATFASPTDGFFLYEGTGNGLTVTGLLPSTTYTFAAYGKGTGASYSATPKTVSATTTAATSVTRYVDAVKGNNSPNDCLTATNPCQSISYAMSVASAGVGSGAGDTISVAPGTYNQNQPVFEQFPITVKSGVKLVSTGGAEVTLVDAVGINNRVFFCDQSNSETLIEGFTITGGFVHPTVPSGSTTYGGGISITGDVKIRRNIIKGNEVRGSDGGGQFYPSGGLAQGGGIVVFGGAPAIVNNVFVGNIARGGQGVSNPDTTPGGAGGNGQGGAIHTVFSTGITIINNTFYGNSAIGGNGGSSQGSGGFGGNASFGGATVYGGTIANNIFINNTATGGSGGGGSTAGTAGSGSYPSLQYDNSTATNNLFAAVDGDTIGSAAVVNQDPRLHSPSNWRLRYTSPAIGQGTPTGAPAIDFDGTARPTTAAPNGPAIGAFEAPTLTPAATGSVMGPPLNTNVAVGAGTGVSVNLSSFSGGDIIADAYSSGRTGGVPTANASAYFWTIATTASNLAGTLTLDFTAKGVGNPQTVKLLRRSGSGTAWKEVTPVTRSGNTISTSVTGFSDFALGDVQAATTTVLTVSPDPADAGHPVTLTATVSGSGGTPTGSVTFSEGATTLGTAPLASGTASLTISGCSESLASCLHAGSHSLTASYAGDASFTGSTGTLTFPVNKDTTTTTLSGSASTLSVGTPITFTAITFCHSGSPYGIVTFRDGATALGSASIVNTVASFTTSALGVGTHSITAEYGGSADFLPSTSAALTVTVNAGTGTASLSIADITVSEGNSGTSTASFSVTLANGGSQTVTVSYATADATASAGSDYVAASGTLSFPSGTTSQTIDVTINGDTTVESNESFTVNLSSPSNATLARAAATGTISNDDSAATSVTVSIDDRAVTEGSASSAAFRVFLSAAANQNVTVDYATADGAANAGSDYTSSSGTLTFTPGRTQHSIVVPIVSDSASEGIEMFFVNLSNPTNATLARGQAQGTISDPPAALHAAMYRAYNKNTDYHFFTTDLNSKNFAVGVLGFQDESTPVPFYVSNVQLSGTTPLFRMYNPNLGRHYYTGGTANRDFLMSIGMVYEKDEGFIYPIEAGAQISGTTELFRLYNNNSGTHLFTADANQKNGVLNLFPGIWVQHTSVGYVFTAP